MHFEFIESITQVNAQQWDALWPSAYPFCQHAFLLALESSGSTSESSGWQPQHLIGKSEVDNSLAFAMPLYLKTHSFGEYVFDWAWADAYARLGLNYYPKLLNATPFTPASGPRLAFLDSDNLQNPALYSEIVATIQKHAALLQASGFHCLFPDSQHSALDQVDSLIERQGCQFHWFNNNYQSFDDFLSQFSSRKRKNINKERRKTADFQFTMQPASAVSEADWALFYQLYHRTYLKRSGRPGYLNKDFFLQLAESMPEQLLLARANVDAKTLAGAVYFRDNHCLYGRYWGTQVDIDGLHFETCYYRGIEYAIENKLARFDPGAQGEHKIQRGFQAVTTRSYHWLAQTQFTESIKQFCQQEREHNQQYIDDARSYLPFKQGTALVKPNILIGGD